MLLVLVTNGSFLLYSDVERVSSRQTTKRRRWSVDQGEGDELRQARSAVTKSNTSGSQSSTSQLPPKKKKRKTKESTETSARAEYAPIATGASAVTAPDAPVPKSQPDPSIEANEVSHRKTTLTGQSRRKSPSKMRRKSKRASKTVSFLETLSESGVGRSGDEDSSTARQAFGEDEPFSASSHALWPSLLPAVDDDKDNDNNSGSDSSTLKPLLPSSQPEPRQGETDETTEKIPTHYKKENVEGRIVLTFKHKDAITLQMMKSPPKKVPTDADLKALAKSFVTVHATLAGKPGAPLNVENVHLRKQLLKEWQRLQRGIDSSEAEQDKRRKLKKATGERKAAIAWLRHDKGYFEKTDNELWDMYCAMYFKQEAKWCAAIRLWKKRYEVLDQTDKTGPNVDDMEGEFAEEQLARKTKTGKVNEALTTNLEANTRKQLSNTEAHISIRELAIRYITAYDMRLIEMGVDMAQFQKMSDITRQNIARMARGLPLIELPLYAPTVTPTPTQREEMYSSQPTGVQTLDKDGIEINETPKQLQQKGPKLRAPGRARVRWNWTDEQIDEHAELWRATSQASYEEDVKKGGKNSVPPHELSRFVSDLKGQRELCLVRKQIFEADDGVVFENAGAGDCGPHAFIDGLKILGVYDPAEHTVPKLREAVSIAEKNNQPFDGMHPADHDWSRAFWDTDDFARAAWKYKVDVMLISCVKRRIGSMIRYFSFPSPGERGRNVLTGNVIRIFGGRDSYTPQPGEKPSRFDLKGEAHWRLLVFKPTRKQVAMFKRGSETLQEAWAHHGVIKEELVQLNEDYESEGEGDS